MDEAFCLPFGEHLMRHELAHYPELVAAVDALGNSQGAVIEQCLAIQQIAAPTFAEGERAAFVERRLAASPLVDIMQDEVNNIYARLPGRTRQPALLISAHTDTVFPAEVNLASRRDDTQHRLYGPGVGDNAMGVAALLVLAQTLSSLPSPPVDIWFVANTGEEGLGDLRGMRAAVNRLQERLGACLVIEGMGLGRIVHQALGSRRFRISVNAPGGHSWSAFGSPSAVHTLVQLAERLTRLEAPTSPRTTFNIGRIAGGTSVNTIAESAMLELDLRSEQSRTLEALIEQALTIVRRFQTPSWRGRGVIVGVETIGDRPSGEIAADHPLVLAAERALQGVGVAVEPGERISSTDANAPLSRGIPAVCVGVTRGGNAHRVDEWISTRELGKGMQHLLLLTGWAAAWLAGEL
jgi:acetylornithine deacetylase/succinyl-diaminopimelate desuccinylase-like protein